MKTFADGRLPTFADANHGSVKIFKPWKLLVIPFTDAYIDSKVHHVHFFKIFS